MKRITLDDINNNEFYKLFKFLFTEKYINLSNDAKVLYSLLRDRLTLSEANNWVNNEGQVYLIYTVDDIKKILCCGKNKAINCKKELAEYGLIEEERQGLNRPNLLFLTAESTINTGSLKSKPPVVSKLNFRKFKNQTSRSLKSKPLEVSKLNPNKTNMNKTDKNKTNNSKCLISINYLKNEELNELFIQYLDMRKKKYLELAHDPEEQKKFKTDENQIVSLLNRLKDLSEGSDFMMQRMLLTSIKKEWANFFNPNFNN